MKRDVSIGLFFMSIAVTIIVPSCGGGKLPGGLTGTGSPQAGAGGRNVSSASGTTGAGAAGSGGCVPDFPGCDKSAAGCAMTKCGAAFDECDTDPQYSTVCQSELTALVDCACNMQLGGAPTAVTSDCKPQTSPEWHLAGCIVAKCSPMVICGPKCGDIYCPEGANCVGGACACPKDAPTICDYDGKHPQCVDVNSDFANCGKCGVQCGGCECVNGTCQGCNAAPAASTGADAAVSAVSASSSSGTGGSGPCLNPSTLHPPPANGPTIYCPFSGSPSKYCTKETQHCCEPDKMALLSTCEDINTPCANGDVDWQCEDPTDCPAGTQCCSNGGATLVVSPDPNCLNYAIGFHGTSCGVNCPDNGIKMCTSDAECGGLTCVPFRAKGNDVGGCH